MVLLTLTDVLVSGIPSSKNKFRHGSLLGTNFTNQKKKILPTINNCFEINNIGCSSYVGFPLPLFNSPIDSNPQKLFTLLLTAISRRSFEKTVSENTKKLTWGISPVDCYHQLVLMLTTR